MSQSSSPSLLAPAAVLAGIAAFVGLPFWATTLAEAPTAQAETPVAITLTEPAPVAEPPAAPEPIAFAPDRESFDAAVRAYLLDNPEVIIEALRVYEGRQRAEAEARAAAAVADNLDALTNDGFSWVGGNPEGDVTVVEFLDYNCGFCRRAHGEVAALLEADPNVRLVVKEWPVLGPPSVFAGQVALATLEVGGPDVYKTLHDRMMAHNGPLQREQIRAYAEEAGLDWAQIETTMGSDAIRERLAANYALAEALGIEGTPAFVVGEELIGGFVPAERLAEAVADARAN